MDSLYDFTFLSRHLFRPDGWSGDLDGLAPGSGRRSASMDCTLGRTPSYWRDYSSEGLLRVMGQTRTEKHQPPDCRPPHFECFSVSHFRIYSPALPSLHQSTVSATRQASGLPSMSQQHQALRKRKSGGERVRVTRACDRCKRYAILNSLR